MGLIEPCVSDLTLPLCGIPLLQFSNAIRVDLVLPFLIVFTICDILDFNGADLYVPLICLINELYPRCIKLCENQDERGQPNPR